MSSGTLFGRGTLLGLKTPNRVVMGPLTRCRSNIFDSPFDSPGILAQSIIFVPKLSASCSQTTGSAAAQRN
jgi:hypothetical protein